jgi:hypothetical protein
MTAIRKPQWLNEGEPPPDTACMVWCKDADGEYRLPFPWYWRDGAWYGAGKNKPVAMRVIGWCADAPRKTREA